MIKPTKHKAIPSLSLIDDFPSLIIEEIIIAHTAAPIPFNADLTIGISWKFSISEAIEEKIIYDGDITPRVEIMLPMMPLSL